jgi:two-component system chemotaxis sensor kinase CheA
MDLSQYIGVFLEESEEHLQSLNEHLLELEKSPSLETLDEIFRSAHTLKGMAATMGFDDVAKLTHQMENVLQKLKTNEIAVTSRVVDVLFKCLDNLESMVQLIASGSDQKTDIKDLMEILALIETDQAPAGVVPTPEIEVALASEEALANVDANSIGDEILADLASLGLNQYEENIIHEAKHKGFKTYQIVVRLQEGCLLKQARAFMVFSALGKFGDIIKSIPHVQELEKEDFDLEILIVLLTSEAIDQISKSVRSIAEIDDVIIKEMAISEPREVTEADEAEEHVNVVELSQEDKHPVIEQMAAKKTDAHAKTGRALQTVRVDIERLDKLMNLVGELVISKTRLDQIGRSSNMGDLPETTEQIDRISTDLQALVMQVRMVPVEQVFNRFPRMVRDLSKELGKEIDFVIEGQETELDRTVIDEIGDPIVHLLRNSIDHGMESPEDRVAFGKPRVGNITLSARHEGNNVVIEVLDNGRGIDVEVLKGSALQKGLISQEDFEKITDTEALNLILLPGFSTAVNVTDVSGRGVGMDAVRTKIESLSGTIKIETEKGSFTRISIWLPLTLAIIQALLIKVCGEVYAIPLANIEETLAVEENEIKHIQQNEVILLRGNTLSLVRLKGLLEAEGHCEAEDGLINIVVVRKGDKRAGCVVDSLIGQQEIVIKGMGRLLTGIPGISGATILGSGEVALILDVADII